MNPDLTTLIARAARLGRSTAEAMTTVGARLGDLVDAVDELRNEQPASNEQSPARKRGKSTPRATTEFSQLDSEKATRALRKAGVILR